MEVICYKLKINYNSINSMLINVDKNVMKIYFNLYHPPLLFKNSDNTNGVHNSDVRNKGFWIRENEFNGCDSETIGKCNVLMIEINTIKNENIVKRKTNDIQDPFRLLYGLNRFKRMPIYFSHISHHKSVDNNDINEKLIDDITKSLSNDFPVVYAYYSLFSHTFRISDELFLKNKVKEFNEKVKEFNITDGKTLEETLFVSNTLIDKMIIFSSLSALISLFKENKARNDKWKPVSRDLKMTKQDEIVSIRRCILTPTRILVLAPQPTLKSRFIESSNPDYTVRLSVREDDMEGFSYSIRGLRQTKFLHKVIKKRLMDGIKIGDRVYEFLGSFSSQLRDSGMILYAADENGRTADEIRNNIGDMSEYYRNVPKYVARLGLAFSQVMTHLEIDLNKAQIDYVPDIEGEFKPNPKKRGKLTNERYIFSDGIGKISQELAERVYDKLENECRTKPCAMQIRFGGCKGLLVIDPNLKGQHIVFRNSMRKYKSDENKLGILKLSFPRPLYLNRPLITILEQLQVKPKVLLGLLMSNLKNMANSLLCECHAVELLQESSTLGIPYRKLLKSGIPFLSEPLFRSLVECVINHRITELKAKARLRLPMNKGRTVFGVLDESNTLEYGKVFVQLSHVDEDLMPQNETFILNKEIMVTKFPCLHPGDVRKLEAVDVPALHHIKDCIVFPAKGKRPHPDEMAGSDLDGDEYAVVFDFDELIFKGENHSPMHFPSNSADPLEYDAKTEDILDFYCHYIVSNNVGLIANAHLANADRLNKEIFHNICMSLAKKYAVALDFAKTGKVERILWNERPKLYPDFMEKFVTKKTYLSNNCLGQLYRHCDLYEMGMQSKADLKIQVTHNPKLEIYGWEKYENSASDAFETYKKSITHLLNRFGVETEALLLSGAFSRTTKYMSGRQESRDIHEFLENLVEKVFIEFRERFRTESKNDNKDERRLRASAWYMIPYRQIHDMNNSFFGFSWTITEQYCELMSDHTSDHRFEGENHDCVEHCGQIIDEYLVKNYIYKEPEFEENNNTVDEQTRREKIMETRCLAAEQLLLAWLERQDHLLFKKKVGKRILSVIDGSMSDMDRKFRRNLMARRIKLMSEAKHGNKPLKSTGNLVMSFLKESMEEWLSIEKLKENNRIADTPLVKFGFSALITLNHFFKTRQISHIIDLRSKFQISLEAMVKNTTIYISLPKGLFFKDYVEYMVQNKDKFTEKMRSLSDAIEVKLEPYQLQNKRLEYYYLLTANGTVWSLQTIKNFITLPSFMNVVKKWRKKC